MTGNIIFRTDRKSIEFICTGWKEKDFKIAIEGVVSREQLDALNDSIVPGAVGEMYKLFGRPRYFDKTWDGENTVEVIPIRMINSGLWKAKYSFVGYPETLSFSPVEANDNFYDIKVNFAVSGQFQRYEASGCYYEEYGGGGPM